MLVSFTALCMFSPTGTLTKPESVLVTVQLKKLPVPQTNFIIGDTNNQIALSGTVPSKKPGVKVTIMQDIPNVGFQRVGEAVSGPKGRWAQIIPLTSPVEVAVFKTTIIGDNGKKLTSPPARILVQNPPAAPPREQAVHVNPQGVPIPVEGKEERKDYNFLHRYAVGSNPARWDPCDGPISWMVNKGEGPTDAVEIAQRSVAALQRATGLEFTYLGETSYMPKASINQEIPLPADLIIAWADSPGEGKTVQEESDLLAADQKSLGAGAIEAYGYQFNDGSIVNVVGAGYAVVNNKTNDRFPYNNGGVMATLMHELAHAVGLGHSGKMEELMYPELGAQPPAYQDGDLSGLALLGVGEGCLDVPSARRAVS